MPHCKHFDVCHLDIDQQRDPGSEYCFLHDPNSNKDRRRFSAVLDGYLEQNNSDFRHFTFPADYHPFHKGTFSRRVDFTDAVFGGGLNMQGAHLHEGLILKTSSISGINLSGAIVDGAVTLQVGDNTGEIHCLKARVSGRFKIAATSCREIRLDGAQLSETLDIAIDKKLGWLNLSGAQLAKGLVAKALAFNDFNIAQTQCLGRAVIEAKSANLNGTSATFQDDFRIQADELGELKLDDAFFAGNVALEAAVIQNCTLARAKIWKEFRIENSQIKNPAGVSFGSISFADTCELHLNNTLFLGDLDIIGSPPPKSISLNGSHVTGKLTIHSELGARSIDVIADEKRPVLGREVSFANVDLSRFRFIGNFFDKMEISNIKWKRSWWGRRNMLYDEVVMRDLEKTLSKKRFFKKVFGAEQKTAPWGTLKEMYQILKEKYRQMGDHATSGDFHYGEMEARRQEYGWPKRVLCLEFLYWLFSGYGIGYIRAFLILIFFIFLFAGFYYTCGGIPLQGNSGKSLLFSFQTGVLLRPARPDGLTMAGEWAHAIESIVVPVQAALFVLALRMRLKR